MARYFVTWSIDIEAGSARLAALQALAIQRDPESHAVVFQVHSTKLPLGGREIDLGNGGAYVDRRTCGCPVPHPTHHPHKAKKNENEKKRESK